MEFLLHSPFFSLFFYGDDDGLSLLEAHRYHHQAHPMLRLAGILGV